MTLRTNSCTLEGQISTQPKLRKMGEKQNFTVMGFMLKWEGELKAGKQFKPTVSMFINLPGKLAESNTHLKLGDLLSVTGSLRRDKTTNKETGKDEWFYKIEATDISQIQEIPMMEEIEELPW